MKKHVPFFNTRPRLLCLSLFHTLCFPFFPGLLSPCSNFCMLDTMLPLVPHSLPSDNGVLSQYLAAAACKNVHQQLHLRQLLLLLFRCMVVRLSVLLAGRLLLLVMWWWWLTTTCCPLPGVCTTQCLCSGSGGCQLTRGG